MEEQHQEVRESERRKKGREGEREKDRLRNSPTIYTHILCNHKWELHVCTCRYFFRSLRFKFYAIAQLLFSYPVKSGGDVGRSSAVVPLLSHDSQFTEEIVSYGCSAVQGFFRSIALSVESSLQDTLRYIRMIVQSLA